MDSLLMSWFVDRVRKELIVNKRESYHTRTNQESGL